MFFLFSYCLNSICVSLLNSSIYYHIPESSMFQVEMSVSVRHHESKPSFGTCTFSSLLIGTTNLRWNRRSKKSASNRCCKMSGGNKLPTGAVRLCGIASVKFQLKVSTLENQNSEGKNNNSNGRD